MTVEEAIEARLLSDGTVTALVSTRVYQLKLPQNPELPAIRVQLASDPQPGHLRGPDGCTRARVQIDAYGDESTAAKPYEHLSEIAAAVNAALVMEPFTVEGSPDRMLIAGCQRDNRMVLYEAEELRCLRIFQDYHVWYRELTT